MALIGCPIESLARALGKRVAPETALCNGLVRVNNAASLMDADSVLP
jgi:hypothetical protein